MSSLAGGAVSRLHEILRGGFGKGAFPHQLWFLLEIPGRRLVQSPEQLAERLRLAPDAHVLEVGPGSGFFSVALARAVPCGRLVLFDLQAEFLARVRRRLSAAGRGNGSFARGDARRLPFADASLDAVVLVAVLGEVPDRRACLHEVFRVLRPGGLLSVSEQRPDPDFVPREELDALAAGAGFAATERWGPPRGYTAHFRKPEASAARRAPGD
jgi:ubiquinone/menaquinone biosynthesis C-methylase UbiE